MSMGCNTAMKWAVSCFPKANKKDSRIFSRSFPKWRGIFWPVRWSSDTLNVVPLGCKILLPYKKNLKACLPKVKCSPAFAWREIVALQSMLNRKFRITLPEYPRESSFPLMLELLFSFASFQVALFLEPGHSSIRYMHCGCSKTIGLGWGRREGTFDSMKTAHMPVLGSCRFSDFPKESFLLSHTPQSQGTLPRP